MRKWAPKLPSEAGGRDGSTDGALAHEPWRPNAMEYSTATSARWSLIGWMGRRRRRPSRRRKHIVHQHHMHMVCVGVHAQYVECGRAHANERGASGE